MSAKQYEEIPVVTLASGYRLALPVHKVVGIEPGPTLGLIAMLHGDEPLPTVIFRRVLQEVDPAQLRGTLLMIPVANPLAYEALTRHTPLDMGNLNRLFPGAPGGWLTEQIAHAIVTYFVPQIDYLLDWHSGGTFPTVDYVFLSKLRPSMSYAFGCPVIYDGAIFEGALAQITQERNIPTVMVEIGGGSLLDEKYIELGVRGTFNVLKDLDMLDEDPDVPPPQTVVKELVTIRPRAGGLLYPEVGLDQLGQVVPGGTALGRIISPYTFEELEVLSAPFERSLLVLLRGAISRVNPGEYAYMAANADVE